MNVYNERDQLNKILSYKPIDTKLLEEAFAKVELTQKLKKGKDAENFKKSKEMFTDLISKINKVNKGFAKAL